MARFALFVVILALTMMSFVSGVSKVEITYETILERTMPAYALILRANLLNLTECRKELDVFREAIEYRKLWGLKMLDSSGEPKPGFIYGNNYWLGSRSQCNDVVNKVPFVLVDRVHRNNSKYRNVDEEFPPFEVNYFVAHFRHNSTLQYHVRLPNEDLVTLGLCLPASCSMDEVSVILESMFRDRTLLLGNLYDADFKLIEVKDLNDDHLWLINGRMILVGFILAFILAMMLIGTIYDVLVHQKSLTAKKRLKNETNGTINCNGLKQTLDNVESMVPTVRQQSRLGKIVLCFSIYTNTKIIFDTRLSADSVPPIHGMKFLGMVWIIMIHTVFYMSDYADNKPWSWRMSQGFAVQVISNSTLSVDTFFFLSGFLVSYLYLNSIRNKQESKPINYRTKLNEFLVTVLRRFIRLTPAYMMTVGIVEINSAWYSETSQFYMTERPQDTCAKYWWRNLLYINNLFGRDQMCMSWSWYLSNDMQFFIISSFLLILSTIYFYTSVSILALLLVSSTLLTGYISYIYEYVPTMDEQYNMLDMLYDPPWTRIGPYIVGIVTAYILIKLNNKLVLQKRTLVINWCLGSLCNVIVLFGLWQRHISVILAAFYVAMSRTVWAIGLGWLLIACCTKKGGIINTILSFKGWIPLSRLTYCAYLLNPFLINSLYLHAETPRHVDFLPIGAVFLGSMAITYCCAYAFSLMFETPNVLLMRMLINSRNRKR